MLSKPAPVKKSRRTIPQLNCLVGAVNHGPTELRPHLMWRSEIANILSSKVWRKTRHENRCTHNFGIAGGMMC